MIEEVNQGAPFFFFTEQRLVQLTGRKARTVRQLLAHLYKVSGSTIFYHTHQRFLEHHFEKRVVYNDFAIWVTHSLQDEPLGEKLGILDLREFTTIRQLRETIIAIIETHVSQLGNHSARRSRPGEEFHFCRSRSFIVPSGLVANTVGEFFDKFRSITNPSLYFHFLESRLRLGGQTNDFSRWLAARGEPGLAAAIDRLNPYTRTLDELKADIITLGGR